MKFKVLGNIIYIDTYFIPEDEKYPICGSTNLYKKGHAIKTIKHCTYYTSLFIVNYHIQNYKYKECNHIFREKILFLMQPNNYLKKQSLLFLIGETLKYMICSHQDTKKIENCFEKIYLEERLKVKYIIIDTWESYRDVAKRYFKNAKTAINSFHIMEHIKKQTIQ